jgi:hypothetical protein
VKRSSTLVSVAVLVAVLAAPVASFAQGDVTSLKTVHALLLKAVEQGNVGLVGNLVHPQAIGFFADSQFPVILGSQQSIADVVSTLMSDLAMFTRVQYDAEYRVVGTTGIVAVRATQQPNPGTRARPVYLRSTFVFTDVDGKWMLLSWHTSVMPLNK